MLRGVTFVRMKAGFYGAQQSYLYPSFSRNSYLHSCRRILWRPAQCSRNDHIFLFRFRNVLVSHQTVPLTFHNKIALMVLLSSSRLRINV